MIEIVFSDSAGGSLKMAQHYGEGKYCGGTVGIIINHSDGCMPTKADIENAQREIEERKRLAWEKAVPLGGNSADVFSFNLAWSVGSIADSCLGMERLAVLERLFGIYPEDIGKPAAKELYQSAIKNLDLIRNKAGNGETLRIWYSNQPDEICGLHWFMNLLKSWKLLSVKVVLVKLPEWTMDEATIVRYNSWGEVEPGKWHNYLGLQMTAPEVLINAIASHWSDLQKENAPLRAVINGRLQSVPESFYDDFILREIGFEKNEFHEANLIGRILGKYQLGISDGWLALRIEGMIRSGKLRVVTSAPEGSPSYHRILKKNE
ncbi:MAG TPA: DUF1835 domain-containing protein [Clostridiaceae bacterium]|nr:DUF1835 domain-containing protein [Clostridiaceae bacterium]